MGCKQERKRFRKGRGKTWREKAYLVRQLFELLRREVRKSKSGIRPCIIPFTIPIVETLYITDQHVS